jgi:peptidyl-dipeptidase Dcp
VNPLLEPGPLPYGFPDFAAIREEHFAEAFATAMADQRAEVAAITAQPGPPTFENTVVALERSGGALRRVSAVFFVLVGSLSTPRIRKIEAELAPALAAHADAITLDPALFARLETLAAAPPDLDPESLRLLERRHRDAVRAGARLGAAEQDRLRALNAELSALSAEFGSRLLAATNAAAVVVDDPAQLDGLSPDAIAAAAGAAEARGHPGRWLLPLVLPTGQPALASLTDRGLRERIHRASTSRGACDGPHGTGDLVRRITALRAQRAGLLGHPHHASWVVEVGTAGTVEAVEALLAALVPPAVRNAEAEQAELDAVAGHPIEPWDRAFHAERVRRGRAENTAALRPYLELERVLHDGVFATAGDLYGLSFTERHDLPGYHPDVRVFHVERDGDPVGLFVADHYARETKRGGAWMNSFVVQSRLLGTRPVVLNTLNLAKPADGAPTLLSVAEVVTLFHEFGHALHGLLSDVAYPTFAGTGVPRDFVEFPSQVNEVWLRDPAVVARYARHHLTGAPLPPELADRLTDPAPAFGEGWATTEYLAAAVLDLAWHRLAPGEEVDDVAAFEAAALAAAGVAVPSVPPRYRSTYFNHVFAGAYSAAYYSYIWSEVLDADTVEWFAEHGGLRRRNGEAFRDALLARGGSVDPMAAYRAFRGRDPQIGPLLARRGLTG